MTIRHRPLFLVVLFSTVLCARAAAGGIHKLEHDWTVQFGGAFGDDYQVGLQGVSGGATVVCYGHGSRYVPVPLEALVAAAGLCGVLAGAGWWFVRPRPVP